MLPERSTDSWDLTKLSNSELFRREALTLTYLKNFLDNSRKCVKDQLSTGQKKLQEARVSVGSQLEGTVYHGGVVLAAGAGGS